MEAKLMNAVIKLKAIKQKDGKVILHLKDNEGHDRDKTITTDINPGGKITWELDNNSDIKEIIDIYPKEGSQNIFAEKPQPVAGTNKWEGIVAKEASGKESYNIRFRYKDDSEEVNDPIVRIKPPTK